VYFIIIEKWARYKERVTWLTHHMDASYWPDSIPTLFLNKISQHGSIQKRHME
jgi:hypothetical protein